ncbi:hypothetical protein RSO01_86570 [Reyranella soli]|uniref:Transporter n=2 Tax=Reyranella soli TaxID=1230389 RepID=A0A512NRB8_9HYPH|nr:hypothetical protein RSO01_86570 [Reyranella soli]
MPPIADIIAQDPVGMKQRRRYRWAAALWRAVAVLALAAPATTAAKDDSQNEANDPLTPKMAFQVHDYAQPILSERPEAGAHQLYLRHVLPHDALGVDQIARASLPLIANSWGPHGAWNGIGDFTVYDMAIAYIGQTKLGAGPLATAPTASAPALGSGKWQGGAQTVVSAAHDWGLSALLSSYQQAFDGTLQTLTIQPLLFLNLDGGYYLRSTGISTFNLGHNSVVPVGLGLGRVFERPDGRVVNVFVEPQYSVLQTGPGVPAFQIFTGVVLQFPVRRRR